MTFFIGIAGAAGAGKDTLAQAMVSQIQDLVPQNGAVYIKQLSRPLKILANGIGLDTENRDNKEVDRPLYIDDTFWENLQTAVIAALPMQDEDTQAEFYSYIADWVLSESQGDMFDSSTWRISPRRFMQYVGTEIGRTHFGCDFWVNNLKRLCQEHFPTATIIVSDVRFDNELSFVDTAIGVASLEANPVSAHSSERVGSNVANHALVDLVVCNHSSIEKLTENAWAASFLVAYKIQNQ